MWCCIMLTSILTLIRPVMLLLISVGILTVLIATSGGGVFLCRDETLCLPAVWTVRPILLRAYTFWDSLDFSTFIFLIILELSLKYSCAPPISYRVHSVSYPSMIMPALSLFLHLFMLSFSWRFFLLRGCNFPRVLVALCTVSSIMEAVSCFAKFACCCLLNGVQHWVSVVVLDPWLVWLLSSRLKYSLRLGSSCLVLYGP